MKKTSLILSGAFSLAVLAAVCCAAQAPGEGAPQDSGMWQDEGPGAGRGGGPGMAPSSLKRRAEEKGGANRMDWPGIRPGGQEPADDQEMAGLIKKYDPAFAAKLAELKKTAPNNYRLLMRMSGKMAMVARLENDEDMEKDAVRAFSLEYETKELSRKYDKASDGDRDKIKKELGVKVSELFDIRLKLQGAKIQRMERDLARLRKNLETRRANKARIVEERAGQLIGEGYGW
jgi:hypothetical protein